MSNVFGIAVSGMNAAASRLYNAATNLVNVSSTGSLPTAEGEKATSYQPTDVISIPTSVGDNNFGVTTQTVAREPAYYPAYDPSSPNANEQGVVAAPNVDVVTEILNMKLAELAYSASAKAIAVEQRNQETLVDTLS
ncbi:MAG: flagellar basal body rod C-terminal domain-containing protein [Alphaproteobacteria bacterium]|nr:flagellar basal body rod C-terminal domain-containing protein [Alphaproteobacteria bacterium]